MKSSDKEPARQILDLILDAVKAGTIQGIYNRVSPGEDGRIRTVESPSGTETGRPNSSDTFLEKSTNLLNLPKKVAKLDPLYDVRSCIIADPGEVLIEADYASAERRLLSYLADERRAIEQIEAGINTYKWFGNELYGCGLVSKDDPRYHLFKTICLSADRGVEWRTLMQETNKDTDLTGVSISAPDSKKAINLFHGLYPAYRRYFRKIEDEIRKTGQTTNICGRVRQFFGRRDSAQAWHSIVKEAVSFQAQAVADLVSAALVRIYTKYQPRYLHIHLHTYDGILLSAKKGDVAKVCRLVKAEMERPVKVGAHEIVLPVEISVGQSWGMLTEHS
jgi:DNA polymerase-1